MILAKILIVLLNHDIYTYKHIEFHLYMSWKISDFVKLVYFMKCQASGGILAQVTYAIEGKCYRPIHKVLYSEQILIVLKFQGYVEWKLYVSNVIHVVQIHHWHMTIIYY